MTTTNDLPDDAAGLAEERILSRALDRRAEADEWDALERGVERDRGLAQRLVRALRDDALLARAVDVRLVELPAVELPAAESARPSAWRRPRAAVLLAVAGWAAACLLALRLVASDDGRTAPPAHDATASRADDASADPAREDGATSGDAMRDPRSGRLADASVPDAPAGDGDLPLVLHEFPRVLVDTQPTDDGRYSVTWLRRVLETQVVDQAYELVEDEFGRPTAVPTDLSKLAVSDIL